jgi:hypothetical protein
VTIGEAPAEAKFTLGLLFTSHDCQSAMVPIVTARQVRPLWSERGVGKQLPIAEYASKRDIMR